MAVRPIVINAATSVREAARNMIRSHSRHLPVCGDSGLVGIIDISDTCRALIDPDVSQPTAADAALRPDCLTPATNELPP